VYLYSKRYANIHNEYFVPLRTHPRQLVNRILSGGAMLDVIRQNLSEITRLSQQLLDMELSADLRQDFLGVYQAASTGMPSVLSTIEGLLPSKTFLQAVSQCSSEWRSPITMISGFCQLAQQGFYGDLPSEQQDLIQKIEQLAEELGILSAPSKDHDPDAL
jgi:signal transduction histidine kinase